MANYLQKVYTSLDTCVQNAYWKATEKLENVGIKREFVNSALVVGGLSVGASSILSFRAIGSDGFT